MGDKEYTLVISVDLSCCRCRKAIQDYLCKMQRKQCMRIVLIAYDEKNNHVLVTGPFDPEQLKTKLLCKLCKIIKGIEIKKPPPTPPKDPKKDRFIKNCLEEYEEISKCIEKCKKECEEKCRTECEKKFKCKCKRKCKCDCDCDCISNANEKPPELPTCEKPTKPPMCPWPPQVTVVCCARPCPCLTPWSNNYRCCSCGVESWPGMCGPGWGSGPRHGGNQQWSNCESSQTANIIFASEPACSIR